MAIENVASEQEPEGLGEGGAGGMDGSSTGGADDVGPDADEEDNEGPVAGEDEQDEDATGRSGAVLGEEDDELEQDEPTSAGSGV